MSHSNTDRMLAYWEGLRGPGLAPPRAAVDPAAFADVITSVFMIGRLATGAYALRLAGALLDDLHHGPLLGSDVLDLWAGADRPRVKAALEAALQRGAPLLAQAQGRTAEGHQAKIELLMAPLAGPTGAVDRLLGFYQPTSPLFRLQNQRIERLFLQEIAFAGSGEATPAPLRLAAMDGRRIA